MDKLVDPSDPSSVWHHYVIFSLYSDGMLEYLIVHDCHNFVQTEKLSGKVRSYYLAAEVEDWNYAPSGINMYDGSNLTEPGR